NVGHADFVDDISGNWWMVLLASRPSDGVCPLGRETFMVPIFWENDWPFVVTKTGLIESEYALPQLQKENRWSHEHSCDHFNGKLPVNWLVLRMPVNEKDAAYGYSDKTGALRLFLKPETMRGRGHPAFAGRRIRHKDWAFSAAIEFTPKANGETAGIILMQNEDYHYKLELCFSSGKTQLRLTKAAGKEKPDEVIASLDIQSTLPSVLAATCKDMELAFFYGKDQYSLNHFNCGDSVTAHILSTEYAGGFVGSLSGVFASSNGKNSNNYADILWAEYRGL
ncbi:MAG: family 43 glycosylhydrolase, partial [Treponema sp.]|nr:family 43 glycosylhydrolase [Treponema sp.]